MIFWTRIDTPVHPMVLVEEDGKLIEVNMSNAELPDEIIQEKLEQHDPDTYQQDSPFLNRVEAELAEYFAGKRTDFDIGYAFHGTEFQQKVWNVIASVPYGETLSYGEIAGIIDKPNAARAVGSACGKNPVSVIVPCHRVLAANGKLGGYGGGLDVKRALLELEGVEYKNEK
ncbi:MAG: methylated-DNA--[protein]-cysteine S-methyltransferase [Candidatus Marinimicrobia bacterium]|nr:methylated-DNA--[protein]-cysteine S-methyltransferase [Candidatus Neomarinimicrobiota bacterium]MCF7829878.1 methylated-DNA--[protein]-cysteine S-methyltransferase [Candidatus Neomarinimicrobiota bacterium]MCF7879159.1 methylated-DNA--[protein]-cysteine S-methyltransferase [Candidatus Neomarinimicrobiota bacterium]